MEKQNALNQFIDALIINNDVQNGGFRLHTTVYRHAFYVYKNNNDTIFIKPLDGQGHFPQPQQRILNILNDESIMNERDLPYVKPIVEYIKEHYLMR